MVLRLKPRSVASINYSLLITLPTEFTYFHNINKKDKVSVEISDDEDGRALIIRPIAQVKEIEVEQK